MQTDQRKLQSLNLINFLFDHTLNQSSKQLSLIYNISMKCIYCYLMFPEREIYNKSQTNKKMTYAIKYA